MLSRFFENTDLRNRPHIFARGYLPKIKKIWCLCLKSSYKRFQLAISPIIDQENSRYIGVTNTVLTFILVIFSYHSSGMMVVWEISGCSVNSSSVLAFIKELQCSSHRKSKLNFENVEECQNSNWCCSLVTQRCSSGLLIWCLSKFGIMENFESIKEKWIIFQYSNRSSPCGHRSVMLHAYPRWVWKSM